MDTNTKGKLDYYYKNEVSHKNYYKMPKNIFAAEFSELSLNAKVAYMFMLDRVGLSDTNNWVDESGRVRIIFTQEQLSKLLCCSVKTVGRIFKELTSFYGKNDGLIELIPQGKSKPYIIYVKKINNSSEGKISGNIGYNVQSKETASNVEKYSTTNIDKTNIVENYVENSVEIESVSKNISNIEKNFAETKTNLPLVIGQNCSSQQDKNTFHDKTNCPTSQNKNNHNKISNNDINHSFIQESKEKPKLTRDSKPKLNEGKKDKIDSASIVRQMYNGKELPYEYMNDCTKMEVAIKHLVDFNTMEYNFENNYVEPYVYAVQKLFVNTLVNLLTCKKMVLKNREIYSSKVYDLLCDYIKFSNTEVVIPAYLSVIDDVAISNYTKASMNSEIRNPSHYMAVCIFDALNNGDIKMQNEIYTLIKADKN